MLEHKRSAAAAGAALAEERAKTEAYAALMQRERAETERQVREAEQEKERPFAGLEDKSQCFCGAALPPAPPAPVTNCNMMCSGNASENCGGANALQLFGSVAHIEFRIVSISPKIDENLVFSISPWTRRASARSILARLAGLALQTY